MTRFEQLKWRELTPLDRQAWRAFRAADPALRSPYFDLGWMDAVDRARGDLHVVKASRRGEPMGFLPFHPGLMGCARPAGGTFADWHGFVAAPDAEIDARAALAAGPATLRFEGTPAGDRGAGPLRRGLRPLQRRWTSPAASRPTPGRRGGRRPRRCPGSAGRCASWRPTGGPWRCGSATRAARRSTR